MRHTSTVFPLAAWRMSPGRMPLPSIMFSQDAVMMCTCSSTSHTSRCLYEAMEPGIAWHVGRAAMSQAQGASLKLSTCMQCFVRYFGRLACPCS